MSSHAPSPTVLPRRSVLLGVIALFLAGLQPGSPVAAQGPAQRLPSSIHPETSSAAEALLKTAASHVRQGQWEPAVELYQRAIQQFPEALTALGPTDAAEGVEVYVNVSEYAQRQISRLPAEALVSYRTRVDGEARHLFEQGRERLDPEPLRRVIESFFCSSWGDDAAELLADLSFQEGRFDEALGLYRRLIPTPDEATTALVFPDPNIDVARVAAKVILSSEAAGLGVEQDELRRFAEAYPASEGELAGRRGLYVESLADALAEDGLRLPRSLDARWPTFAGDPSRTKVMPEPVDPGAMVWSIPLRAPFDAASNLDAPPRFGGMDFGMPEEDFPSFFPVIQGDEILLTDGRTIQSYALEGSTDGPTVPPPAWRASLPAGSPMAARPTIGFERHTLTVHHGRIYARLGPSGTEYQMRNNASAPATAIVALDRSRSDSPLWLKSADEVVTAPGQVNGAALAGQVAFGGAPLADDHGVYVTLLKPGTQALTWLASLDPETGQTLWLRYICSGTTPTFGRNDGFRNPGMIVNPELGHRLLALAGSTLYYQTDLGALASVDARSGRLNWLATYPRAIGTPPGPRSPVNHNPAVVHGDRVIIAPEDSDRIFAFERSSGRLSWQADPGGRATHLLGVISGKVVATGNHVWTIDARTGEIRSRWPEGQTLEEGYGRGLLAGGEIYWPTRDRLYILDQETGRPTDRPPIPLREAYGCGGGNLVAGDGYLLIAERDQLRVFCKPSRMLRYYQERIAVEPGDPAHYYRLARTAESLGDDHLALVSLDRTLELASPGDRIDGLRLTSAAMSQRHKIHLRLAGRLMADGEPSAAVAQLSRAIEDAPSPRDRLSAELAMADAKAAAGDPAGAAEVLQSLLDRPEAREVELPADDHRSLRAELLVVDRLRVLIHEAGPAIYARHDATAGALLRRGIEDQDPRLIGEVVRSYPASAHIPEALQAIGALEERRSEWARAAHAYHQLLVCSEGQLPRAHGLLGLARCYEALDLPTEAREAYTLATSLYGDQEIDLADRPQRLSDYVADRMSPAPDGSSGGSAPAGLPLLRTASQRWPDGFASLDLDDPIASFPAGDMRPGVLLGDGELRGIDPVSGDRIWGATIGFRPAWSGVAGGRLIVAGRDQIIGLDPADGSTAWEILVEAGELAFGRPAPDRVGMAPPSAGFHGFRLYGDRLYFFRGDRDLICLDPVAGRPAWTYRAGSIAIDPHLGLGLARVAIQLRTPNAIAVLDAADGRTLGLFPQDDSAGPWRRDPFPVAIDRVAIVPDASSVLLLDLQGGRTIWEAREQSPLPSSPRPSPSDPMVFGDAGRLLVLRGEMLQRLDPANGDVLWSTHLGRIRSDRRSEALVLGAEALFFVGAPDSGLSAGAVALDSGERSWMEPLTGDINETWGLGLTPDCVVAYRLDDGTPGTGVDEPVVLNLLRRDSGRRVQRLVVDDSGPARRVRVRPDGVTVAGATGLWHLEGPRGSDGPVATLEGAER